MTHKNQINLIWQTFNGDQTTFEFEYITEVLFKNFEQNRVYDDGKLSAVLDNTVIIYSNNSNTVSNEFNKYLDKFVENKFNFYLLHFSNENLSHNCDYYSKANHVFRNYYDSNISEKNVTFIPLGFKSGFFNNSSEIKSTEKIFNFSFIGQPKSDRNELISILESMENVFIHKTNSWNCITSLSQSECKNIYEKTKFIPCPMGWVHPDSFRIMETLECGSIPILKNYNNLEYFNKVWGENIIPKVNSWEELRELKKMGEDEYELLKTKVYDWYFEFKKNLSSKISYKIENSKNIEKKMKEIKVFNTDKFSHGYMEIYEPLFKEMQNSSKVLEIGIYKGDSLKLLQYWFENAKIYGIDINNLDYLNENNIQTFVCNQESRDDLKKVIDSVGEDIDLIIDDGGHTMKQQQVSFGFLFSKLRPGGVYILEDLHTSRIENFGTIFPEDLITSLDMLFNFKYTGNIVSNHMTEEEREYIKNNIESVKIWTSTPEYNRSVTSIIKKK